MRIYKICLPLNTSVQDEYCRIGVNVLKNLNMRSRTPSVHIKKDAVFQNMWLPKLELFKVAECQKMRMFACAF